MNRFEYASAQLRDDETFVAKVKNIKLYDGDQKVSDLNRVLNRIKLTPSPSFLLCIIIINRRRTRMEK